MYYITLAFTLPADIYFIRTTIVAIHAIMVGILITSKMFYSVLYLSMALLTNIVDYKITGFRENNDAV